MPIDNTKQAIDYAAMPDERGHFGIYGGRFVSETLMQALDADGDGEISAKEIEGAVDALKQLDRNGDGKLSGDELRPGPPGPGGPDGWAGVPGSGRGVPRGPGGFRREPGRGGAPPRQSRDDEASRQRPRIPPIRTTSRPPRN